MHGLSVSPALGTKFSGNGDFFGLAYNGDYETDVLGYPYKQAPAKGDSPSPGPNIVGLVRYTKGLPEEQRIAIEDFSFPNAYIDGAKAAFGLIRGMDTVIGNEDAQRDRLARDFDPTARGARSRRRDESLHAVPGDGAGQRARVDSVRGAVDRTRRADPHLLGQGRAAADLHAHERGDPPPRARAARQLHRQPDVEHVQPAAPDHGASAGRLPDGRRLPARRGGPVRARVRGRWQRAQGTVRDRWLGDPERAGSQSVPDHLGADGALRGA